MDFKEFALFAYPYWILGICVLLAVVLAGKKSWLRVNKRVLIDWTRFLILATAIRYVLYLLFPHCFIFDTLKNASFLPWQTPLTVFWEDATHGLPLFILRGLLKRSKWNNRLYALIMSIFMVSFGLGHLYQGIFAALTIALYVPFSVEVGRKYGFGTVILAHMLYDGFSMFFMKCLFGL